MIRVVDKKDYDVHKPENYPPFYQELAWYATDDNTVLGVIVYDRLDRDYDWLVLTENDQRPGYTAIDFGHSLTNEALATQALHSAMQADLLRSDYDQHMDALASRIAEEVDGEPGGECHIRLLSGDRFRCEQRARGGTWRAAKGSLQVPDLLDG